VQPTSATRKAVFAGASLCLALGVPCAAEPEITAGKFLVANRDLRDPNFSFSVILLVSHGADGAMGLIINRPSDVTLESLLPKLRGTARAGAAVYFGGPVEVGSLSMVLRSTSEHADATPVFEDVHFSRSWSLLQELAAESEGASFRVFAGYAGWAPGQLENEVQRGDWLILPADAGVVFGDDPERLWREIIPRDPSRSAMVRTHRTAFPPEPLR
jgi:putative transcriptional regulator